MIWFKMERNGRVFYPSTTILMDKQWNGGINGRARDTVLPARLRYSSIDPAFKAAAGRL